MSTFVPRTCTEVADEAGGFGSAASQPRRRHQRSLRPRDEAGSFESTGSKPLAAFRGCGAYVLLGAPGSGKTAAFKREAEGNTEANRYCDARDFLTCGPERWADAGTLFIDALDETRAGRTDGRTPLDRIRAKLDKLKGPRRDKLERPRFRLSCREADWFGAADRRRLEAVSPDGVVTVLRLDPLSEDNIRELLRGKAVGDVDRFIAEAGDRGIEALLSNPQTLNLLADAVARGNWPDTRTATFESACRSLVREHNEEHLQAAPKPADSELLNTAGRLCTVQLLAGRTGYRQPDTAADDGDGIDLRDLPSPNRDSLLAALHTSVFDSANGLIAPVHRHIAEFVAGRYLSSRIDAGLPVRRVLALVTGEDGRPVSALRGLAAWLAAHCKASRDEIVERDPLGTVLYGDVREFSADQKRHLLDCLERDAERDPQIFAAIHDLDSRWGDLATPAMEDTFRAVLAAPAGGPGRQTIALAVLKALERGAVIPGLIPMLPDVVRDGERCSSVREAALDAYVRQCGDAGDAPRELKALLDAVYAGSVSDPFDNLLGRLLMELYPGTVSPAEVVRYLRKPKRKFFTGWYAWFWNYDVIERSTDEQLAEVLDALVDVHGDGQGADEDGTPLPYWVRMIPAKLLATYLKRSPAVDDNRLFAWLGLAMKSTDHSAKAGIQAWLGSHPASCKAVVRLAADRSEPDRLYYEIGSRLPIGTEPADFGEWCLTQAAATATNTDTATDFFLSRVVDRQDQEGISDETVEKRLAHEPGLVAEYRRHKTQRQQMEQAKAEFASRSTVLEQQARQRRREWRSLDKTHGSALRENRAAPALLDILASVYLGRVSDVPGETGRLRLRDLLGNDDLVDTVIAALRASPARTDLPDETEILRLADQGKQHLLMLPFMVGLNEHPPLRPGEPPLDEPGMRRALTFRFGAPYRWDQEPDWYRSVLTCRPDLVAEVLVRSIRADLRHGAKACTGLYELSHDDGHAPVARRVVMPLLKSFPTRCNVGQLNVLAQLLHAAFLHADHDDLRQVVESRLTLRSMDPGPRMYWLCAGLLVAPASSAPASFPDRLRQALAGRGRERRVRHMAEFLSRSRLASMEALEVPALELLIESLGNACRPYGWTENDPAMAKAGTATDSTDTSRLVDSLINTLSSRPSRAASDALQRLSEEAPLRPWQLKLREAASRQREVRREADFRHPTVERVLATLDNLRPANAADLAALTMDVLRDLAREIRDGDTSPWRRYWNVDEYNRPVGPRPENACRDTLLSDLRAKLKRLNVDAQPEGRYADERRADIRVSCDGFNVPVEIKKSDHHELWTALRQQLMGKYARDPGADGYGIYLVFWFGDDRCRRPPTGPVPENPAALEEGLVAGLSPEEKRKIGVCVIDVSKPHSRPDRIQR